MASENANREKTVKVEYLTRVEGEGGVYVRSEGGELREVKLNIFEPPRFFEAFLRGRSLQEVPDITARICGICPAYNRGCYGCFGPLEAPNSDSLSAQLLKDGMQRADLVRLLRGFTGFAEAFRSAGDKWDKL